MSLSLPASATSEGGSSDSSSDIDTTASAASGAAANSDDASPDTDDFKRPCIVQVVDSPSLVEGPADVTYPSWSAWNEYLKAYSVKSRQVIRIQSTLSCVLRNKRLGQTAAAKQGMDVPYVPETWGAYQRTYICTHGWPAKDRSSGLRTKHFVRGCGCPFRFVVQLVQVDGLCCLRVKNGVYQHNHAVGTAQFKTYPEKP
ncbi:uncharacterized protein PITG_15893 [Phytophthora infestans T30-4]|uniref:FAR1 domain-containing protein n=1 Tax=Phytophthora infestans (strain T30-4) TaxID=403677 RepID=D0NS00_PHYIT|nr:uncharacterized protein PITG_15893 [Phytophthora infestans T30-4]EEY63541.1 conserved hypothetical protein [Phytophthora infestans T30-4]|eukprot:XP_002898128.1 conserved hypothetical protein [Phytophthora infestans T30-4]